MTHNSPTSSRTPQRRLQRALSAAARATLCAACALAITACASDEDKIKTKLDFVFQKCKADAGPTFDVPIEGLDPYPMLTSACAKPFTDIKLTDAINATAQKGPYTIGLRKTTGDGRWHIHQVTWPDLDEGRSLTKADDIPAADVPKAIAAFTKVEAADPTLDEATLALMRLHLLNRKRANKGKDPDRAGLGKDAQAYLDASVAKAKANTNPALEAKLRLQVAEYYDAYRKLAEESSTPSETAGEWEEAATNAVIKDAEEAKAKGDTATYDKKMKEVEARRKESAQNVIQREKDAKTMAALAIELKKRECAELQLIQGIAKAPSTLLSNAASMRSAAGCK